MNGTQTSIQKLNVSLLFFVWANVEYQGILDKDCKF